jgi:hypothetical protein
MGGSALLALGLLSGRPEALLRLVLGQATFLVLLATAAWTGIIASGFLHCRPTLN